MAHLNAIYRSDILSFMPHPNLHQKCRYVSRNFNGTTVVGTEACRLPRRKFRCIDIRVTQIDPEKLNNRELQFDVDGYSNELPFFRHGGNSRYYANDTEWGWQTGDRRKRRSVIDKLGCCSWKKVGGSLVLRRSKGTSPTLQPLSKSLAGQLLFPAFLPDAEISINVMPCNPKTTKGVCLAFRNELTAKTAFSLVHLLHHLKGSATLAANITFDVEGAEESSGLNLAVVSILRAEAMKFHVVDGRTGCGQLNEGEMKVLSEMAHVGAFHARAWADELLENGDAFFHFVLSAGDFCRTVKLELHDLGSRLGARGRAASVELPPTGAFFDMIIEKFESGIKQIGGHAISKLVLTHSLISLPPTALKVGEEAWPKRCPPKAALSSIEYSVNTKQEERESSENEEEGSKSSENDEEQDSDDENVYMHGGWGSRPWPDDASEETDEETRDEELAEMVKEAKRKQRMSPDGSTTDSETGADVRYRVDESEEDEPGESYRLYEFAFENVHSHEPFRVLLKTVPGVADAIDTVEFILR